MDDPTIHSLAVEAGLLTRNHQLTVANKTDLIHKLNRYTILVMEYLAKQQGTQAGIHRATLETKIAEYLNTLDDRHESEHFCTEHFLGKQELKNFTDWLYQADIEREKRYAEFLKLKAEFEPVPTVVWERKDRGYIAKLNDQLVGSVRPDNHDAGWTADRWNGAKIIDAKHFDSRDEAKTWAVGHL